MAFSRKFQMECFLSVFFKNLQSENKWAVEIEDSLSMRLGLLVLRDSKINLKIV